MVWCRHMMLLVVCLLLAVGCSGTLGSKLPAFPKTLSLTSEKDEHRLSAGDQFQVLVFGQDNLSGRFQVKDDGKFSLPGAGQIVAAGVTAPELEQRIVQQLQASGVADPQVSVLIDAGGFVQIFGAVERPGEYAFREDVDLVGVVQLAGGYTPLADQTIAFVVRAGETGEIAYPIGSVPPLQPGDAIRIPRRQ